MNRGACELCLHAIIGLLWDPVVVVVFLAVGVSTRGRREGGKCYSCAMCDILLVVR